MTHLPRLLFGLGLVAVFGCSSSDSDEPAFTGGTGGVAASDGGGSGGASGGAWTGGTSSGGTAGGGTSSGGTSSGGAAGSGGTGGTGGAASCVISEITTIKDDPKFVAARFAYTSGALKVYGETCQPKGTAG